MNRTKLMENLIEIIPATTGHIKIIDETLSRMGIGNNKKKILYRTCHLVEIEGRYFIVHFKELFLLHDKTAYFSEDDIPRRNKIVEMLETWGLLSVVDKPGMYVWNDEVVEECEEVKVFIISHKQKENWEIVSKYTPKESYSE